VTHPPIPAERPHFSVVVRQYPGPSSCARRGSSDIALVAGNRDWTGPSERFVNWTGFGFKPWFHRTASIIRI